MAFTVLIAALALFQITLVVGAPLGRFAWGGNHDRLPPRLRAGSAVAVIVYIGFAGLALGRAQVITTPLAGLDLAIAMWAVTGYLLFSVLPNASSKSRYEKRLMTPISAALAMLALAVSLS